MSTSEAEARWEAEEAERWKRAWAEYTASVDVNRDKLPPKVKAAADQLNEAIRGTVPLHNETGPALYALIAALCEARS